MGLKGCTFTKNVTRMLLLSQVAEEEGREEDGSEAEHSLCVFLHQAPHPGEPHQEGGLKGSTLQSAASLQQSNSGQEDVKWG